MRPQRKAGGLRPAPVALRSGPTGSSGTSGSRRTRRRSTAGNSHPFLLSGIALAHNGTFHGKIGKEGDERRVSDTLVFLELLSERWKDRTSRCWRRSSGECFRTRTRGGLFRREPADRGGRRAVRAAPIPQAPRVLHAVRFGDRRRAGRCRASRSTTADGGSSRTANCSISRPGSPHRPPCRRRREPGTQTYLWVGAVTSSGNASRDPLQPRRPSAS